MDRETNKKLSQKINREEAIKIFGEEIVNEAEQEQIMKAKEYNQKTLLENEDLIRCNYFTGQAALINLSQGSRDVQEIDDLFKDEKLGTKQQEIQKETQKRLDNLNVATSGVTNMLKDVYGTRDSNLELQSEVAFGQAGLAAALTDKMSGKTIKISKQEAIKKFGKNAVKEAENKADANVKFDTDGDGKVDTSMNEANKKEEEMQEAAYKYEKDYDQGRSDGYAGRAKAKNTPGYNVGYVNGQFQKEAENKPDKIIEIKEELFEEDTPRHR